MNEDKLTELSNKLLGYIRNRLFFQYRFLEPALYRLEVSPFCLVPDGFGTDGTMLFYDPEALVHRFRENPILEMRRFLHSVFHCIYLHPFQAMTNDIDILGLAYDIMIEASILMQLEDFKLPDDDTRFQIIQKINKEVPLLTSDEVIHYLDERQNEHEILRRLFTFDSHFWMKPKLVYIKDQKSKDGDTDEKKLKKGNERDEDNQHSDEPGDCNSNNDDTERGDTNNGELNDEKTLDDDDSECNESDSSTSGDAGGDGETDPSGNAEGEETTSIGQGSSILDMSKCEEWKEAAQRISMDMKAFSGQGTEPGMIELNIDYLTRDKMDYDEFLRQFAMLEEVVTLDSDEFDYMYYMYGLSMPGPRKLLIEPLEYREVKRIREFVIAIDTSGSCAGELVRKFLNKTYSILKSTECFNSAVNIHIIQCDATVQEDIQINRIEEIEAYSKNFKVRGCGGTDFRPVFEYVEKLRKERVLTDLNGLIYFTDGYGTYPKQPTGYKTAFVFLDDYFEKTVPSWAMRVYWKEPKE